MLGNISTKSIKKLSGKLKTIGKSFEGFNFNQAIDTQIKTQIVLAFKSRKSQLKNLAIESLAKARIVYKATFQGRNTNKVLPPSRIKNITNFIQNDIFNR